MRSWVSFLLFIGMAILFVGGWHTYLWLRLARDPAWPDGVRRALTIAVWTLGALMVAGVPLAIVLPKPLGKAVGYVAYVWMGSGFILLVALLFADLLRAPWTLTEWVRRLITDGPPPDPERRIFLARGIAMATAATSVGLTVVGLRGALGEVDVREVPVKLERLPRQLDGLSIVQITDLHVGPTLGRAWVEQVIERVNSLRPDIVAVTGDLMDGSVAQLFDSVSPLAKLKPRWGTFFVTGNHEYYSGISEWLPALRKLGVRTLENERVLVGDGVVHIDLCGVHDFSASRSAMRTGGNWLPDLPRALEGRDPERALVLLAHQPKHVLEAEPLGVDLQLSGHTHGGQIWPFGYAVRAFNQPYVAGLSRHGKAQIYVSRGTGFWGPPLRVGAPAEITRIVLAS